MLVVQWLTNQILTPVVQGRFAVRENMYLLFNSDTVNLVCDILIGGRNRRPNFVTFVVWSTLIVGGWVVMRVLVAWSKKSCLGPAEIASFVFLVLF